MEKIPFSVYDFFAYLSSGAVLVITADYVWGARLLHSEEVGPFLGAALIILAYIAGHVLAHFSSFFYEQLAVHRLLGSPASLLLGKKPRWTMLSWIFKNYHRPLSLSTQKRVKDQAELRNCHAEGEGLFQHAYPLVTQNERYQARLDDFRNQYGFARNASFAFLVSAVGICIAHRYGSAAIQLRWAAIAAVAAVSLFYRYLKFFRQYSYELFLRYSELPPVAAKAASAG